MSGTEKMNKEEARKLLDIAMLAGQIMMESNAETYRVEETMRHILRVSRFSTCEAFAMATGILATLEDKDMDSLTEVRRIPKRDTNLAKVHQVNTISRRLTVGQITLDEAYTQLERLQEVREYPGFITSSCLVLMCTAYAALYGGGWCEVLATFCLSLLMPLLSHYLQHWKVSSFMRNVLTYTVFVCLTVGLQRNFVPNLDIGVVIIGAMMPAVPGTAITNAIRDTLRGDYTSGVARAAEAFVIALSIVLGVSIAFLIMGGVSRI